MKRFVIVLLAVLLVFAFASCKQDPHVDDTTSSTVYRLTATKGVGSGIFSYDKFAITFTPEGGVKLHDKIHLKFRSTREITSFNIRNSNGKWIYEEDIDGVEKGNDGWYTLDFEFGENWSTRDSKNKGGLVNYDRQPNFRLDFISRFFVPGDMLEIKDLTINGKAVAIDDTMATDYVAPTIEANPASAWPGAQNYTVLYFVSFIDDEDEGGDEHPTVETVLPGEKAKAALSKDGYTLVGIYTAASALTADEAGRAPYVFNKETDTIDNNTNLFVLWKGVDRTVTFDLDGGTIGEDTTATQTVENGKQATDPGTPEKEGFIFLGWLDGEDAFDLADPIYGDTVLKAKWVAERTVTFNMKGHGEQIAAKKVADGTAVAAPEAPKTSGWRFKGWYTDETFEEDKKYDFSTLVEGDKELFALWEAAETVKFTYDLNYEGADEAVEVDVFVDEPATGPDEPKRAGYVFKGWFDGDDEEYTFEENVSEAMTLYAHWAQAFGQLTTSKGIADGRTSYEKFQLNIDLRDVMGSEAGLQSGDVLTLKFRTSRDIYQYDIRTNKKVLVDGASSSIDVRWVYEGFRGTLADPVLGDDGWYTLTYTFGDSYYASKTAPDYDNNQYYNIGINFRCLMVAGDIFEIKDVKLTRGLDEYDIPMKSSYNAATSFISYANVEDYEWAISNCVVGYYETSEPSKVPTEVVAPGDHPTGLSEEGFTFTYFSSSSMGDEDVIDIASTVITEDTRIYFKKTEVPQSN